MVVESPAIVDFEQYKKAKEAAFDEPVSVFEREYIITKKDYSRGRVSNVEMWEDVLDNTMWIIQTTIEPLYPRPHNLSNKFVLIGLPEEEK